MGTNGVLQIGRDQFLPEELSAFVLKSLKADAEKELGETIEDAVISVPAYFNDIQRKATIAAAQIAGFNVRRLINEPTAAALAYGLHAKENESTFLVVDLGGGTFDVTILEMFSGVMEVRASAGDAFLGGEDFTDCICSYFLKSLGYEEDGLPNADHARLRALAEKIKQQLSSSPTANGVFVREGTEYPLTISRTLFEELTEKLTRRIRLPIQRAISDAQLTPAQIDRIILVGGATRMPVISNLMTKLFKRFPEFDLNPDHVVALGAAVQAGLLERHKALEEMVMTDVCPFTLGHDISRILSGPNDLETGIFAPLIERNTTVPVSRSHIITPLRPGGRHLAIDIYQGEAPYVKDNIKIGSYNVPIPYNPKECENVDIRFTYDTSGVLEVLGTVVSTGVVSKLIIERTPGQMSPQEIKQRFTALERIKIHPRDEIKNAALIARLNAEYENTLGQQRQSISDWLVTFEIALKTHDKREIEAARKAVEEHLQFLSGSNAFE
ncbi:MAG: Hsp70 family protein [Rhizobiales bacterium]|nr:Hsp70 family protein [Hyphomicrobiales bacterium]